MIQRLNLLFKKLLPSILSSDIEQFSITKIPYWVIVVGLLLVVMISLSGFLNLYYLNKSHKEIEKINEIITLTQTIQIDFGNQLALLHAMLLENDNEEYRKYFHKFSYQYTIVQNQLFNLKIMLNEYPAIKQNMEHIVHYHKQFSELLIDEITQYKENRISAHDVYSIIKGKDQLATDLLSKVCNDINEVSYDKIIKTKNRYFTFSVIAVSGISVVSLILVLVILYIVKAEKQFLLSIGSQLSSYLPSQLVQMILRRQKQEIIPLQKRFITVCFTDIQGFTKLTDVSEAEIAADILNQYLTQMTTIAHKFNGTVDKFLGDGIMIIFGAPYSMIPSMQVDNALNMAIEMQKVFQKLQISWKNQLKDHSLHLRIGIHCGYATVGSFGPSDRLTFTAIGKVVNIASRLEQLCSEDSILISSDVKKLAPSIQTTRMELVTIRGIEQPVEVYTIQYK
ncbi:MAG: adenylate/guanylate cyclase domain-containing protein [Spirochaetes bacterium]|nr:adenylate/guanylate cyclase domain-containing protein [Spirochaetota bacterium]